jgi:hypothetical protein
MMKNNYLVCVLILLGLSACEKQDDRMTEKDVKKEINLVFIDLVKSAKTLNVDDYMQFFDKENFSGINSDGTIITSFDVFKSIYASGVKYLKSYKSLVFPKVEISVINSTTAILVNEYKMVGILASGAEFTANGAGTQVWSKETGKWKLVSVSASDQK